MWYRESHHSYRLVLYNGHVSLYVVAAQIFQRVQPRSLEPVMDDASGKLAVLLCFQNRNIYHHVIDNYRHVM